MIAVVDDGRVIGAQRTGDGGNGTVADAIATAGDGADDGGTVVVGGAEITMARHSRARGNPEKHVRRRSRRHLTVADGGDSTDGDGNGDGNGDDTVATVKLRWHRHAADSIDANHIHLHLIHLPDLTTTPTADDRARAARLRDPVRRDQYLKGRAGLRTLLAAAGVTAPRFTYGDRGKPALVNESIQFNYTLSGGYALYAFARDRQLGVDMEVLPRDLNADRLARRIHTAAERRAWEALPSSAQSRAMLACWTRKEAYGKCVGVGIRYHLNRAPVCENLNSAAWRCRVVGLFDGDGDDGDGHGDHRVLNGVQLKLPIPALAALVYDGDELTPSSLRAFIYKPK